MWPAVLVPKNPDNTVGEIQEGLALLLAQNAACDVGLHLMDEGPQQNDSSHDIPPVEGLDS